MVKIANGIDWRALRVEYIRGGVSIREMAEKYNIPFGTVRHHAEVENWTQERKKAEQKVNQLSAQKAAEAAANNATLAEDIKQRLLLRLKRIEEKYPDDATEIRLWTKGKTTIYRIRDLTGAYKELTEDTPKAIQDNAPIVELLRKLDNECV